MTTEKLEYTWVHGCVFGFHVQTEMLCSLSNVYLGLFKDREDFYASLGHCVYLTRGWRRRLASCLATLWQTHLICMFFQPRLSLLPSAKVWHSLGDPSMPAVDYHVIQGKFMLALWEASFNPRVLKMQMFHGFLRVPRAKPGGEVFHMQPHSSSELILR